MFEILCAEMASQEIDKKNGAQKMSRAAPEFKLRFGFFVTSTSDAISV